MARLNHLQQSTDVDCGLAVVAMLAGLPNTVGVKGLAPHIGKGVTTDQMLALSTALTGYEWQMEGRYPYRRLIDYPGSLKVCEGPCAVILREAGSKWGHWIAFDGRCEEVVYDPELTKPVRMNEYPKASWLVVRVIRPVLIG